MTPTMIRFPEHLLAAIDQLADETYTNRSAWIRQACIRHMDIIQNVERPAILEHYKQRIPKLY